ncbi:MAG TPA: branched-chain amino acid ABC transporter permease [Methylomirabilota bacterium]|jgi:branched-chain amino acid transport system permease protein|nr:branched-chain amino acid ABC transporter permease [Methylomirabilota bacterium]
MSVAGPLILVAGGLLLGGIPYLVTSSYVMHLIILSGIYIIFALSYDIVVGYLGMLSLAHPAFYGVGAYTSVLLVMRLEVPFLLALAVAGVLASIVALIVGYPALSLSYHSFAIVTLAFTLIVRIVWINWEGLTNGPMGIPGVPRPRLELPFLGRIDVETSTGYYYFILVLVVLTGLFVYGMIHSRVGRALVSIRENEILAETLGVNAFKYRMMAFAVGAFFAGIAGSFTAHYIAFVGPEFTDFYYITMLLIMVILGGSGTLHGVILGAIVFTFVPEYLRITPEFRDVIYGVILVVTIVFVPGGIGGRLNDLMRSRKTPSHGAAGNR